MFDENWLKKPIYQIAFTHRSYLNETSEKLHSNERLEFLGDAVLAFVISSYLYDLRKNDTEGDLTNLRSFIVKTSSLAKASQKLNLGDILRLSKGEEFSGGRVNTQILANTYEALLGAIYLEQGLNKAREFVNKTLLPFFAEELKAGPPKDAKSVLQEISQDQTKQSPKYQILKTEGPDHAKKFTVAVYLENKQIGVGHGSSKQEAEEQAAKLAVNFLLNQ